MAAWLKFPLQITPHGRISIPCNVRLERIGSIKGDASSFCLKRDGAKRDRFWPSLKIACRGGCHLASFMWCRLTCPVPASIAVSKS